jgi:hypothetical protein
MKEFKFDFLYFTPATRCALFWKTKNRYDDNNFHTIFRSQCNCRIQFDALTWNQVHCTLLCNSSNDKYIPSIHAKDSPMQPLIPPPNGKYLNRGIGDLSIGTSIYVTNSKMFGIIFPIRTLFIVFYFFMV